MIDNPWDEPEEIARDLIRNGRYQLPNLDGTQRPKGRQRATNYIASISDNYALKQWEFGKLLEGIALRHDLVEEICSIDWESLKGKAYKDTVEKFVRKLKDAAKGNEGSRRGTAHHNMVNTLVTTGREIGTPAMKIRLRNFAEALQVHQLDMIPELQERTVILDRFDMAGTFDHGMWCRITQDLLLADTKTQKKFWSLLEPEAQLAVYVRADAMWDSSSRRFVEMPNFNKERGLLLHIDKESDEVNFLNVDLKEGWKTAILCYQVIKRRRRASSAATIRGALKPIPVGYIALVERYAREFGSITTVADGKRLRQECQGLGIWFTELKNCARDAAQRISNAGLDSQGRIL